MKTENKIHLGLGFSVTVKKTDKTLESNESFKLVSDLNRLGNLVEYSGNHNQFCGAVIDFIEKCNQAYAGIGHELKLHAPVPISVMRYNLVDHPDRQVYRFTNLAFMRGQCTVTQTAAMKLPDHITAEVKTIFDMLYKLDFSDPEQPKITRVEKNPEQINDAIKDINSISHGAYVLLAIKNVSKITAGKKHKGRLYTLELTEQTGGDFTITFTPHVVKNDAITVKHENGRLRIILDQKIQKVDIEVNDVTLYEMLNCLKREMEYASPVNQSLRAMRHPRKK